MFSIIIPTLRRYEDLRNTIECLELQSYRDFELIIIDQNDESARQSLQSNGFVITQLFTSIFSATAARNMGLKHAKGDYILFLDDDVLIENRDFLKTYNELYQQYPQIPGIVGCVIEGSQVKTQKRHRLSNLKSNGWLFFPQNFAEYCFVPTGRSCNLSVKRSIALQVNGMDERFERGAHREEADFCIRITKKFGQFLFSPDVCLRHLGNPNGGIRSWNSSPHLKAEHHYVGAFYFIFKNLRFIDYPIHILFAGKYFLFKKEYLKRPQLFFISGFRFLKGILKAAKLLKQGPKYLQLNSIGVK